VNIFFETLKRLEGIGFYQFRTQGFHQIPENRKVVFISNHSGWMALDAVVFLFSMARERPGTALPSVIAHEALFRIPLVSRLLPLVSAVSSADFRKIIHDVKGQKSIDSILIFPEGEHGNCKPFWNAYKMRHWKSGFLRYAFKENALLVPITIVGAEEAFPGLRPVNLINTPLRSIAPFPIGIFPTQFSVRIFKPIDIHQRFEKYLYSAKGVATVIERLQIEHQKRVEKEAKQRPLYRLSSIVAELKKILAEDSERRLGLKTNPQS
jgi:1-acyl-sn-glycerol-3-phosphate acyltransferase